MNYDNILLLPPTAAYAELLGLGPAKGYKSYSHSRPPFLLTFENQTQLSQYSLPNFRRLYLVSEGVEEKEQLLPRTNIAP